MKRIFRQLCLLCFVALVCLFMVNAETDFLRNFKAYFPKISEAKPELANRIESTALWVSKITNYYNVEKLMADIKGEEKPISPNDVAVNSYYEDDIHLNFYPDDYTAIKIGVDWINVFGVSNDSTVSNIATVIYNDAGEDVAQDVSEKENGEYSMRITIPSDIGEGAQVAVFTGSARYGEFESIVNDYLYLNRTDQGDFALRKSVTYESNKALYEKDKSVKDALRATNDIQSDSPTVKELANKLCEGCDGDYEKLVAIHDWICDNLYYDKDILEVYDTIDVASYQYRADDVISKGIAVCRGYAYTFAALARSVGIPCNIVSGYALGIDGDGTWTDENLSPDIDANHAWNEAYVDGRWVIIDSTWDCKNKYVDSVATSGSKNHVYFDSNILFFSQNHRIIKYITE